MAKQGDWVRIHRVILPAEERTANLPEDTKKVPFEMWVKGHLLEDGELGDQVRIRTVSVYCGPAAPLCFQRPFKWEQHYCLIYPRVLNLNIMQEFGLEGVCRN